MRKFSWQEYYEGFYDWSFTTQKTYAYGLTSYGPSVEVAEIATDLEFSDKRFASRFVQKAMEYGVVFTPAEVCEFTSFLDKELLEKAALKTSQKFNEDQLFTIEGMVSIIVFQILSDRAGIDINADEDELEEDVEEAIEEELDDEQAWNLGKPKKMGFFWSLFAFLGSGKSLDDDIFGEGRERRLPRACNDRPPHYGYRYGRWYYGNGHDWGCEEDDGRDF